jgi:hypothetical protein
MGKVNPVIKTERRNRAIKTCFVNGVVSSLLITSGISIAVLISNGVKVFLALHTDAFYYTPEGIALLQDSILVKEYSFLIHGNGMGIGYLGIACFVVSLLIYPAISGIVNNIKCLDNNGQ